MVDDLRMAAGSVSACSRARIFEPPLEIDAGHLRDHVAALLDGDPVADADVFARHLVGIVESRARNRAAGKLYRLQLGHRRQDARTAHLHCDVANPRNRLLRLELVGDRITRRLACHPQNVVGLQIVHLHDDPVTAGRSLSFSLKPNHRSNMRPNQYPLPLKVPLNFLSLNGADDQRAEEIALARFVEADARGLSFFRSSRITARTCARISTPLPLKVPLNFLSLPQQRLLKEGVEGQPQSPIAGRGDAEEDLHRE